MNSYLDKTVSAYNNHSENTLRNEPVSYIRVDEQIIQPGKSAGQDHMGPLCHSI